MILKDSGVSVRQTVDPKSELLGAVFYLYSYPVTDGKKSYVKVKTSDDFIGWAWVGRDNERFEYFDNQVQSIVDYNIPVKDGDKESVIKPNDTVDLIQIWHSRLKVKTPDNKHGWIYAGKYNDQWVKFLDSQALVGDIYVNFSEKDIQTNAVIDASYIDYDFQHKSYKFMSSEESELTLSFDLNDVKDNMALSINHMVSNNNKTSSAISVLINGEIFIENYKPVYDDFKSDLFHIGHFLKKGKNKISIMLEVANTPYYIQSISINN